MCHRFLATRTNLLAGNFDCVYTCVTTITIDFEDYRFSKLQNIKEYQEIKEEKSKIYDKYPSVRELFEDELAKGYTIEEQNAIEEIFRLDGMLDNLELKEAFKLGLREFFVFAIEQDLIKNNEKNSFLSI